MSYKEMFFPELVILDAIVSSKEEAFMLASNILLKKEFVKESYLSGLIKRENTFPTGLITQFLNIALPHTDSEHIARPFVMIMRLKEEIVFKQMGDDQEMMVKDLFFLGIKEAKMQSGLLSLFMNLFVKEAFVNDYIIQDASDKIYQLFEKYIKEG